MLEYDMSKPWDITTRTNVPDAPRASEPPPTGVTRARRRVARIVHRLAEMIDKPRILREVYGDSRDIWVHGDDR